MRRTQLALAALALLLGGCASTGRTTPSLGPLPGVADGIGSIYLVQEKHLIQASLDRDEAWQVLPQPVDGDQVSPGGRRFLYTTDDRAVCVVDRETKASRRIGEGEKPGWYDPEMYTRGAALNPLLAPEGPARG